jgi:hypothetical protein
MSLHAERPGFTRLTAVTKSNKGEISNYEAVQIMYTVYRSIEEDGNEHGRDLVFRIRRDFDVFPPLMLGRRITWPRPLPDVYILILDSVSRRVMRRFAPNVFRLLRKHLPHHHATNFDTFHTLCAGGTLGTVYPMFHGGLSVKGAPSWCSQGISDVQSSWKVNHSAVNECFDPSRRILKLARDAGFAVGLSTNLLFQMYNAFGDPHHATGPSLCVLDSFFSREAVNAEDSFNFANDMIQCPDQFCHGRSNYARKILAWNSEFFRTYPDHPKFLASMLHGAHGHFLDAWGVPQDPCK